MITSAQRLITPLKSVLYSFIIYILFTSIPPEFYESIVEESDLMFFNGYVFLFILACLFFFAMGFLFFQSTPSIRFMKFKYKKSLISKNTFYLIPMLLSLLIIFYMDWELLSKNSLLLILLLNGMGNEMKSGLELNPFFFHFLYFHLAITLWSFYRSIQLNFSPFLKFIVYIMILMTLLTAFIIIARYILLPFIFSLGIIYISMVHVNSSKFNLYLKISFFFSIVIVLFISMALLRGGDAIKGLLGYGPASFNRLAAVLDGSITLTVPPSYYISSLLKNDFVYYEILMDEHSAVARAGLDGSLNWLTAYGYMYYSMGYYTFVYLFILGFFIGLTWKAFLKNKSWAIVFYPWLFTCILLWFSYHILAYSQTLIILFTGMLLSLYSNVFTYKRNSLCSHS
jgi:hypothetical protein